MVSPRHRLCRRGNVLFAMDYPTLKHFHIGCAALSGALFLLRGTRMLAGSARLQARWVRIAPHIVGRG